MMLTKILKFNAQHSKPQELMLKIYSELLHQSGTNPLIIPQTFLQGISVIYTKYQKKKEEAVRMIIQIRVYQQKWWYKFTKKDMKNIFKFLLTQCHIRKLSKKKEPARD